MRGNNLIADIERVRMREVLRLSDDEWLHMNDRDRAERMLAAFENSTDENEQQLALGSWMSLMITAGLPIPPDHTRRLQLIISKTPSRHIRRMAGYAAYQFTPKRSASLDAGPR